MRPDELVDALAATQHGVVARPQLLTAGLTRRQIDLRLAGGRLAALQPGVYAARGHPPTAHQRLVAACLAAGPGAAASHRAAAWLLGLAGLEPAVEITVPLGRVPRLAGVIVHRSGAVLPGDVAAAPPLPATRPARTLIDLAGVVPEPVLRRAVDEALARRLVTADYLDRRLAALGRQGRAGAGTLHRLLDERLSDRVVPESEFERRLFAILRAAGLPLPTAQFEVVLPDGRVRRLDFAWRSERFALEADSYRHHSSRTDWARDHVRNRELIAVGWRLMPVTWPDLAHPAEIVRLVTRGLRVLPRPA